MEQLRGSHQIPVYNAESFQLNTASNDRYKPGLLSVRGFGADLDC